MSRFTSTKVINSRWRNNDFVGAAGSTHTFPDQFHEEFLVDWALQISDGSIVITETPTTGVIQMASLTVGDIVLTGTATGDFGGGGGSGNSTVYYQTTQPTGGTYAAGDLWVDSDATLPSPGTSSSVTVSAPIINSGTSTSAALSIQSASTTNSGAVQLSDSVSTTSSLLAATPTAVKKAYDIATAGWEAYNFGTAGVIATVPRFMLTAVASPVSGSIIHSRIIPHRDFVVNNLAFACSTTVASGATLMRFGIYTRSGTTFTLVARTASDTTIFDTASTKYTRALDTTGGYPATYTMIAGTEYFLSVIQVATTPATLLLATTRSTGSANAATGAQYYTDAGETDLVASSTGSVSATLGGLYAEVS